jgi:hypothetical protein
MLASERWVLYEGVTVKEVGEELSGLLSQNFRMITQGSREEAIEALLNTWLKDPTFRCGWCQETYNEALFPCCEQPFIANNAAIMRQFVKETIMIRNSRANQYASNKDKSMRLALSFPPGLLQFLTLAFETMYNEKLFTEEHDMAWFAKKFGKYFQIPEKM